MYEDTNGFRVVNKKGEDTNKLYFKK